MGDDAYTRYAASADRGSVARSGLSTYSEAPPLTSYPNSTSIDQWHITPDYLQKDTNSIGPGAYGYTDVGGISNYPEPVIGSVASGASAKGYTSPFEDSLASQRQDIAVGSSPGVMGMADTAHERANSLSLRTAEGDPNSSRESNILFVDGLPTDCTRREVGHLFRPFIGYKDIRVVHKEPRRSGDKAMVLCFVEFIEARYARTAMEALQAGYKFDDKKPDSPSLKIQFAHFPFRLPSNHDDRR
ncbi:nuclear speckle RNA-binding protein B-like isoform X3 [Benincasa hispida]|uniref:nuclear speckle RNA-binding protein B-like isoform X3 n=1 Tax=Benincasa hispida TaxID=102211 RepID=UPI001901864A|nr:nuclear speckle RNA-binding protein B-like isoform X3 [Benincasa hispida]